MSFESWFGGTKKLPQPIPVLPETTFGMSVWSVDDVKDAYVRLDDDFGTILRSVSRDNVRNTNPRLSARLLFPLGKGTFGTGASVRLVMANAADPTRTYPFEARILLAPSIDVDVNRPFDTLSPLMTLGQFFVTRDGVPFITKGASAFALQQLFDRDEGMAHFVVKQLADLGFNEARVFTRFRGGLGRYDGNLDTLDDLAQLAEESGVRIEYVASADHKAFGWTDLQEVQWHEQVCDRVRLRNNVSIEGVNEGTHDANRFDYTTLRQPPVLMWSRGSGLSDESTLVPTAAGRYGYATYHPARTFDSPRKGGHNAWEDVAAKFNLPCKSNELMRPDELFPTSTLFVQNDYFDMGADIALLCAGGTFHTNEGKLAQPLGGLSLSCARAFIDGINAVDLNMRTGRYTSGTTPETLPLKLDGLSPSSRAHGKILGNRAQVIVTQRRGVPVAADNGWRIIGQVDNLFTLER